VVTKQQLDQKEGILNRGAKTDWTWGRRSCEHNIIKSEIFPQRNQSRREKKQRTGEWKGVSGLKRDRVRKVRLFEKGWKPDVRFLTYRRPEQPQCVQGGGANAGEAANIKIKRGGYQTLHQ